MFKYTLDNKRYHTLNYSYKTKYHTKVVKIPVNIGCSCPNIVNGGCIYCNGDFEFSKSNKSLIDQFNENKVTFDHKWPNSKYIGYFQAGTNTYAPLEVLKEKYELILKQDNVIGLNIATRPDSITDECLDYLEDLNKKNLE